MINTTHNNHDTLANTRPYHKYMIALLLGLSILRLITLYLSPTNLHGDEAQYWAWSRSFEFGYFSKPPMIAWVIAFTTGLFGNAEWAVRLSSPLIHPLTAYIIFRTARFLFDARTGFWAGCLYFLMPAVWLSSTIVSTDVVLLIWWALGLNAWAHVRETPNMKWATVLGLAIGLGMLSKYAMLFFLIALVICTIIDAKTRKALLSKYGLIVVVIAVIFITPNLYWNAANDFATLNHTAANANLKGVPIHPIELVEFIMSQLVVFGPLSFIALVAALFIVIRKPADKTVFALSVFVLSPLLIICGEAFLSRANANWAVSAYIGGAILTAHIGLRVFGKLTKAGVFVNTGIGVVFIIAVLSPSLANTMGMGNILKRVRGWPQTQSHIVDVVKRGHEGNAYHAVATDNRLVFFDLLYYKIEADTRLPLYMWMNSVHPVHHAEKIAPLPASTISDGPILVVNYFRNCQLTSREEIRICLDTVHALGKQTHFEKIRSDFARLEPLPPLEIDLGGGKIRRLNLWAGYGYTPTQDIRD